MPIRKLVLKIFHFLLTAKFYLFTKLATTHFQENHLTLIAFQMYSTKRLFVVLHLADVCIVYLQISGYLFLHKSLCFPSFFLFSRLAFFTLKEDKYKLKIDSVLFERQICKICVCLSIYIEAQLIYCYGFSEYN